MAFQVGSQVRPELLDYSGYAQGMTNAANITAASLAELGNIAGSAIAKSQENKENKAMDESFLGLIQNNPNIASAMGLDEDASSEDLLTGIKGIRKSLGNDTMKSIYTATFASLLEAGATDIDPAKITKFQKFIDENPNYRRDTETGQIFRKVPGPFFNDEPVDITDPTLAQVEGSEEYFKIGNPLGL